MRMMVRLCVSRTTDIGLWWRGFDAPRGLAVL